MGTINRPNSPLTASDGYSEVDANEVVMAAAINGNLNHENLASEGVRNANIDKDEVFAKETWDNILSDGHFPVWSNGTSSVPDSWTAELTATIARDDAPTYAPSAHYSCKITGAGAAVEGIYQTIELRKNSTYTVNLKVKATAGDTAVIKVVDGDDAEKASQEYTDADWQTDDNKKYFTFTTGTTTNAGEIKIKLLAKVDTDIVWFGEVQVTEGTMAKGFQYISSDADTLDGQQASELSPPGAILMWFSTSSPPIKWLICNGAAISRTTYATLFAVISTTFGVGNGSTTFNLPDFKDKFPVGAGTAYSVNDTGGESTHALSIAELAAHKHTVAMSTGDQVVGEATGGITSQGSTDTSTVGSGTAHENRPPYRGIAFIIKY